MTTTGMDRVTLYVVGFITLLVCFLTILVIQMARNDIMARIDQAVSGANQGVMRMAEREPLRPNMATLPSMPSFTFATAGMSPPSAVKALQQHD